MTELNRGTDVLDPIQTLASALTGTSSAGNDGDVLTKDASVEGGAKWAAAGGGGSQVSGFQVFTASDTFTVPAGVTKIKATLLGGGGGGGGGSNDGVIDNGQAGNNGADSSISFSVSSPPFVVNGQGGEAGFGSEVGGPGPTAIPGNGASPVPPSFNSAFVRHGQQGGIRGASPSGTTGGAGGGGFTNSTAAASSDIKNPLLAIGLPAGGSGGTVGVNGSNGVNGLANSGQGGSGGGGAGLVSGGGAGGGSGSHGQFSVYIVTVVPGETLTVAVGDGGAGGAGASGAITGGNGGNGGSGLVIIEW